MRSIDLIRKAYGEGALTKGDFIRKMYESHSQLFSYQRLLEASNLNAIHIHRGEVVAEFAEPGIRMLCPPGDQRIAPIEALNFGAFEAAEINLVRQLVDHLGGAKVKIFDIGANAGFYSLALSKYFPGITGVAFEPVPLTHSYLKRNLELNNIGEIQALRVGLSDAPGQLTFSVSSEHSGASFLSAVPDGEAAHLVSCSVTTVDQFIGEGGFVPAFIKCDVEGAELMVFKGAKKLLTVHRPAIFTEMLRKWAAKFNYHPNDLIGYFSELGYGCFVIRGENLLPFHSVDSETLDTNYVFLHGESHQAAVLKFCSKG